MGGPFEHTAAVKELDLVEAVCEFEGGGLALVVGSEGVEDEVEEVVLGYGELAEEGFAFEMGTNGGVGGVLMVGQKLVEAEVLALTFATNACAITTEVTLLGGCEATDEFEELFGLSFHGVLETNGGG